MPKVSVIVPVYNVEDKLPRCLDSLLTQTLSDIEFILVNDASTDGSYDILLDYEKQSPERIIVINCEVNRRAGGARNTGLDMASGDYIGFVDSDDYILPDMFECLYNKAVSNDYDIVDSPLFITGTETIREPIDDSFCDHILASNERELLILSDGYIVTKLFKSSLIHDNRIRFRPNVKLEDADFLLKAVLSAQKFGNIHDYKYIYDNTGDPTTWSVRTTDSNEFDHIYSLLEEYGHILKSNSVAKECQNAIKAAILHFYKTGIFCCIHDDGTEMSHRELTNLIKIRNAKNNIFIKEYDNPYFQQTTNEYTIDLMKQIDKISI
ncbi:MAG: glycosyltransferase family 2 protein [Lachnospiraceae bacterium]|nr:glycosyltransferase family 2 protein [Lachnospiraceae bacterium]